MQGEPSKGSDVDGWYYLHPTGQSYGPYTTAALQGKPAVASVLVITTASADLYTQGYVRPEFPIWKQGMAEWVAFSQVPDVSVGAVAPNGMVGMHEGHGVHTHTTGAPRGAVLQQAPARVDELSRFQAEIGQLETQQVYTSSFLCLIRTPSRSTTQPTWPLSWTRRPCRL